MHPWLLVAAQLLVTAPCHSRLRSHLAACQASFQWDLCDTPAVLAFSHHSSCSWAFTGIVAAVIM